METKTTQLSARGNDAATSKLKTANRKINLFLLMFLISASSFAQNMRGFYVNAFNTILGNAASETTLLNYAQSNGYNYLCLYSLASIDLTSATRKNQLASFISRAKTQYGILQVGASGEIYSFFGNYIIPYNQSRTDVREKIDVMNFEFEFWIASSIVNQYCSRYLTPGGYSCDSAGAFAFAKTQFQLIDNAAASNGMMSEVYFGWPNRGQMQWFAQRADRILLHAYRTSDADIYSYTKNRLIDIASINSAVNVTLLLSSESIYMGPWLESHSITQPYTTYSTALTAETGAWKDYIKLQGYQWFKYSTMPAGTPLSATVSANGPLTFCQGGSVLLSANPGSSQTYQWTKNSAAISGATNIDYSATASGDYAVKVSKSGTTASSTAIAVNVTPSVAPPVVSANGPLAFCPGGNVTLTSSSATGNRWSNNATTQSIVVNSGGSYNVTVSSGNCFASSAVVSVSTTSAMQAPVITASGPLSFCPGSSVTLTSSSATGNVWSNNATTQSITVTTAGDYFVTVNSGSCSATSAVTTVTMATSPTAPVISAGGSTKICPGTGVVLTSSLASVGGYQWSTGDTTRSIVAQAAGTYWVRTGTSTCFSQSPNRTVTMKSAPSTPVITVTGNTNLSPGQSVMLTSSSAFGYSWLNGSSSKSITVNTAGNYRVTVMGYNGCKKTSADKIITSTTCTPPPVPVITSSSSNNVLGQSASLTLTSSPAGGYLWSNGQTTQTISVTSAGIYTVRAYNAGYCFSTSLPVTVYMIDPSRYGETPVEVSPKLSLLVYPNPAHGEFRIAFDAEAEEECMINVFDLSGRAVMTRNMAVVSGSNHLDMDAGELIPGIYLVRLSGTNTNGQARLVVTQ